MRHADSLAPGRAGPGVDHPLEHLSAALALLERWVVRRRRLDPVEDRPAMRRLTDEVVPDDDERALSSTMPAPADPQGPARAVCEAVAGWAAAAPPRRSRDRSDLDQQATDPWVWLGTPPG